MVGTNIGKTHTLPQGQGLAQELGRSQALDMYARLGAQKNAAASKDRADGLEKMRERPEDTWHYYSGELNNMFDAWEKEGAKLMTDKNINNLFNSNDPAAIEWRMRGEDLQRYHSNINQYKEQYDAAISDINTRGDQYTNESARQARYFPAIHSFSDVAQGNVEFAPLEHKEPLVSSFETTNKVIDTLRENFSVGDDGYLSEEQLLQGAEQVIADPTMSQGGGGGFVGQLAQSFTKLPPAIQQSYQMMAAANGLNPSNTSHVMRTYIADHLRSSQDSKRMSVPEQAQIFANKQPLDSYSTEDQQGVTQSGTRMRDERAASEDAYFATLLKSPGEVARGVREGLYGDRNASHAENARAAAQWWNSEQQLQYQSKYGLDRRGGRGSQREVEDEYNEWYRRVLSQDETIAKEAIDYAFGADANGNQITRTEIYTMPSNGNRYAILRYNNEKDRQTAIRNTLSDMTYMTPSEIEAQEGKNEFVSKLAEGKTILINLSDPTNGQKFRDLYRQSRQTKKEGYKPTIDDQGKQFFDARSRTRRTPVIIE